MRFKPMSCIYSMHSNCVATRTERDKVELAGVASIRCTQISLLLQLAGKKSMGSVLHLFDALKIRCYTHQRQTCLRGIAVASIRCTQIALLLAAPATIATRDTLHLLDALKLRCYSDRHSGAAVYQSCIYSMHLNCVATSDPYPE